MYFDKENLFSEDQAIIATAASTNQVDLGANAAEIQANPEINSVIVLQVTEAFNTLTSLTVDFETDTDVAFGSAVVLSSVSVPLAGLIVGKQIEFRIPRNVERYIRFNYTVVGTDPTLGKVFVGVTPNVQSANVVGA